MYRCIAAVSCLALFLAWPARGVKRGARSGTIVAKDFVTQFQKNRADLLRILNKHWVPEEIAQLGLRTLRITSQAVAQLGGLAAAKSEPEGTSSFRALLGKDGSLRIDIEKEYPGIEIDHESNGISINDKGNRGRAVKIAFLTLGGNHDSVISPIVQTTLDAPDIKNFLRQDIGGIRADQNLTVNASKRGKSVMTTFEKQWLEQIVAPDTNDSMVALEKTELPGNWALLRPFFDELTTHPPTIQWGLSPALVTVRDLVGRSVELEKNLRKTGSYTALDRELGRTVTLERYGIKKAITRDEKTGQFVGMNLAGDELSLRVKTKDQGRWWITSGRDEDGLGDNITISRPDESYTLRAWNLHKHVQTGKLQMLVALDVRKKHNPPPSP